MAAIRFAILALFGLMASHASAECVAVEFSGTAPSVPAQPPMPPDPELRPSLPECLRGLSRPGDENCPREELARYDREVEEWVATLNAYAIATNRFANELAGYANSAVENARHARQFADSALAFRDCEVSEILAASGE